MNRLFLLFLILALAGNLLADISVKSFRKLENDLDARVGENVIIDFNREPSAIVKVVTTQTGFSFDCGQIGIVKVINKPGEIWVYIPNGAKRITITHDKLGVLRDWFFTIPIEKATVYELVLTTGRVITTVDETVATKFLVITSNPAGADVFINDQHKGQTPFQKEMAEGEYTYRISKDLYHPSAGRINLSTSKDKEQIDIQLKPNFGFAQIFTKPEDGMTVTLDGKVLNQTTPLKTDTLRSGRHVVNVSKPLYHSLEKEIIITDSLTSPFEFVLSPAFGSLKLETKPENGAMISIDGKAINQITPFKIDRLISGEHTITLRKEWFEPKSIKVKITDGVEFIQSVELTPNFGLVQLSADNESEVFVDNELKGKGLWEGRLVAGLHVFEAKKENHHPALQKIEIIVDETKQINLTPQPIVGKLKIVTNAIGAIVKLNDKDYGTTPLVLNNLFAGQYKLTLEKEGFRKFYKNIVIEEGKTTEVNDTLLTGIIVNFQSSPQGAALFIDSKETGKTPLSLMLNIGNHTIKLINGKKVVEEIITVSESGNSTFIYDVSEVVNVQFKGALGNNVIKIDGTVKGEIPLSTKLNIGTHVVKIEKGTEVVEEQIIVTSDGKNEFHFSNRDFIKSFYKKHFLSIGYAYHQTIFTNTKFAERMSSGNITKDYGQAVTLCYNLYPIEISATAFSSGIRVHNLAPFNDNASIKHRGVEFCVDYLLVNIGRGIFPYIGAGYQLSQIYSAKGSMTIGDEAITNTTMPIVKGGLKLKFGHLFIFGEYKQTIPLGSSIYNSKQMSGGLGWIF
jgi:hypothetical protein